MKVLVLGASGFIGSAICRKLLDDGHAVRGLGRSHSRLAPHDEGFGWFQANLTGMTTAAAWTAALDGIDAVVNAAGALQDSGRDDLAGAQQHSIIALIEACEARKGLRYIQISAPGADPEASTGFLKTKGVADRRLQESSLQWNILRPGLVLGSGAYGGTALLRALAGFPLVQPVVHAGAPVQVVALDDVASAVAYLLDHPELAGRADDLVHPQLHRLDDLLLAFRDWLGFPAPRWVIRLPGWVGALTARIANFESRLGWRSPLRSTAMKIMRDGVTGDGQSWTGATGLRLRSLEQSLAAMPSTKQERHFARTQLVFPLIVLILAAFWIVSGVVGLLDVRSAAAVLDGAVPAGLATAFVWAGSVADMLIGVGFLFRKWLRRAALASILVSLGYLLAATLLVPELWLDPLGSLMKVVPAIMLAVVLLALSEER